LPQGVRARTFFEVESVRKLRRDKSSKHRRREAQRFCAMECLNRGCKVARRRTSFHRGILGSPVEDIQEEEIDS
jgi:hypothetical protein